MKRFEPLIWISAIIFFAILVLREGQSLAELQAQVDVEPLDLYRQLASSKTPVQIIDARDLDSYLDTHIPGAIPFPGCDGDSEWALASVASVIVSPDGERSIYEKCRAKFGTARNLGGGMTAWSDEGQPEDEGEYSPPSNRAGGGCL